jgi:hypothetical protein
VIVDAPTARPWLTGCTRVDSRPNRGSIQPRRPRRVYIVRGDSRKPERRVAIGVDVHVVRALETGRVAVSSKAQQLAAHRITGVGRRAEAATARRLERVDKRERNERVAIILVSNHSVLDAGKVAG